MAIDRFKGNPISREETGPRRRKLGALFAAEQENDYDDVNGGYRSFCVVSDVAASRSPPIDNSASFYSNPSTTASSPYNLSPWIESSPYQKSPWIHLPASTPPQFGIDNGGAKYGLIGSLVREEGHVYSIAAAGDLLYTGSDSKNIRVWKNFREYSGFKSSSGLLKAIVLYGDKVFTGHQDGKIRVWRHLGGSKGHRRVGSLPTVRDLLLKSVNPKNYVTARRHRNVPWVKHYDAVSCLSIDADQGLLYSGSWDKSFKVWRISDSKCLESVQAHDDAVNAVAVGFDGLVFTGSADGTVKAWRRELVGPSTRHVLVDTLLRQDHALTSLAVAGPVLYAGSSDGLVSFWSARVGHFMSYGGALRGHKLAVLCLAAAEQLVLTGSADRSICVWRRDNSADSAHSCLAVLSGHTGPVKCLAVEEDAGDRNEKDRRWIVYSGSLDKTIKVWRV